MIITEVGRCFNEDNNFNNYYSVMQLRPLIIIE